MEYKVYSKDAETIGGTILAFVSGFSQPDLAKRILSKHGLDDVEPNKWYPQQAWLDAMKEIEGMIGATVLKRIGSKVVNHAQLDKPDSIKEFFEHLTHSYQMNHKNDSSSYYKVKEAGNDYLDLETNNPYPDAFDRGLFEGFAKLYKDRVNVKLVNQDSNKRSYKITW